MHKSIILKRSNSFLNQQVSFTIITIQQAQRQKTYKSRFVNESAFLNVNTYNVTYCRDTQTKSEKQIYKLNLQFFEQWIHKCLHKESHSGKHTNRRTDILSHIKLIIHFFKMFLFALFFFTFSFILLRFRHVCLRLFALMINGV